MGWLHKQIFSPFLLPVFSIKALNALPHAKASLIIKSRKSYYLFSVTQKLDILEFLCDEIFGMELFSAEMHRRFIVNSVANAPYASLPSPNELKSIVNVDDCAVCGLDGELIYCDNHPGEWLCPECTIGFTVRWEQVQP